MATERKKPLTQRLILASRACRSRAGAYLARYDLHAGQDQVLHALSAHDGLTMSALALQLGVQPPTVTKTVTRLAALGYVSRRSSNGDARQAHVHLTREGRTVANALDEVATTVEAEMLAGLDEKDRKRLRKMLKQIEENFAGLGGLAISAPSRPSRNLAKPAKNNGGKDTGNKNAVKPAAGKGRGNPAEAL